MKLLLLFWAFFAIGCTSRHEKDAAEFLGSITVESPIIKTADFGACDYFGINYAANIDYAGYCGIAGSLQLDPDQFKKDSAGLMAKAKYILNMGDTCNLYVGEVVPSCSYNVPVISLVNDFTPILGFPIDESSVVAVLNFENGDYFKEKPADAKELDLPAPFNHGYSEGVIISQQNRLTHWLIVW
jgi:hypothetical protein